MFDNSEPGSGRPWVSRPWPATMLAVLLLLTAGALYLAVSGRAPAETTAPARSAPAESATPATGPGRALAAGHGGRPVAAALAPTTRAAGVPTAPVAGQASAASPPAGPSVCGLLAGGQKVPVAPPAASWRLLGSVAVPASPVFGPAVVDGAGVGDCFAHSPTGALFAAVGTVAALNLPLDLVDPTVVIADRVAPIGDAYPAMVAQARQAVAAAAGRMPSEASSRQKVALLGFTFTDYTTRRAVINLAVAVGDPAQPSIYSQVLMPVVMVWTGGDWKLVYTDAMTRPQPIVSADQYVGWAP